MKNFALVVLAAALFLGCDEGDPEFVERFQTGWEVSVQDVSSVKLSVAYARLHGDGSATVLLTEDRADQINRKLAAVRISADGTQRTSKDLGTGVFLSAAVDQDEALFLILSSYANSNTFERVIMDANLNLQRQVFQISRPATFHSINFTSTHYFISEYETPFPGIRVRQFSYNNVAGWSQRFSQPQIKPFPWALGDDLLFYRTNGDDSVALTSVSATSGAVAWNNQYVPGALSNQLPPDRTFGPVYNNGLWLSDFSFTSRELRSAAVSMQDGRVLSERAVAIPNDLESVFPVGELSDGGQVVIGYNPTGTSVLKTDRQGNVGWRGNFVPNGRAVLGGNEQLLVATPVKVYRLDPVVE
jgi:hypothetical protein